jgi:hypothetical protein
MKIKVSEATIPQINWLVATLEGETPHLRVPRRLPQLVWLDDFNTARYATDWAQSGRLLTEAHISRTIDHSGLWIAYWTDGYAEGDEGKLAMHCDRSELVAGLRCLVELALGAEVEVPEELCE